MVAQVCRYTKNYCILYFKWVNCMVGASHLNKAVVLKKNEVYYTFAKTNCYCYITVYTVWHKNVWVNRIWIKLTKKSCADTSLAFLAFFSVLLLLLLSRISRVWLCAIPETAAHQASQSLGFSRQEHWSGLPFPSPMYENEKWKWSHWVVSNSQRPHGLQPTRLLHPWDFPGKSTGVGCHCLLRSKS